MAELFDCPACGATIRSETKFGIARCEACDGVFGMGDLRINQNLLDKARDEEQKAEIDAENAWMRAAESWHITDWREEELIRNDPFFQEAEERMYQDRLVWEAHEDMMDLLVEGGM